MPRLGKGLDALISKDVKDAVTSKSLLIPVVKINTNPYQPRRNFDDQSLQELANSIKKKGLIQPIVVRPRGDNYELVVGERRLRAAKLAGFKEVPAIIKDLSNQDLLVVTLIENLQRKDLNPIEEAEGYQRLLTDFDLSHNEIAELTGKSRSTISNKLRLLKLPPDVQKYLARNDITEGHARAMLGLGPGVDLVKLCRRIKSEGLPVRAVERLLKKKVKRKKLSPYSELENFLSKKLGSKVLIRWRGKRGKLIVEFYSQDEFDRVIDILTGNETDR